MPLRHGEGHSQSSQSEPRIETERGPQSRSILIADDDAAIRGILKNQFIEEGYNVTEARTGSEVISAIGQPDKPDLILLDIRMPEMSGLDVLRRMRDAKSDVGVIVMTAYGTSNLAIQSIQLGATNYLTKPFDLEEVSEAAQLYFASKSLQEEVPQVHRRETKDPSDRLIGRDPLMMKIYEKIGQVASSNASVLISGDTGTGKELVAEEIHQRSSRRDFPLVKIALSGLPETLIESELFGHEKGSFTSAVSQRLGRFELADKGTLFLDEIGEMTMGMQKRLLRVLQNGEFERVGGTRTIKVDVRIIAATNRNLAEEIRNGRFRDDLYYRLRVLRIHMPALRERQSDIPLLIDHFLDKHRFSDHSQPARISDAAMRKLEDHEWPGNVRQLENVILGAVVLSQGRVITTDHLDLEL